MSLSITLLRECIELQIVLRLQILGIHGNCRLQMLRECIKLQIVFRLQILGILGILGHCRLQMADTYDLVFSRLKYILSGLCL